jgi:hypothetical protein
MPANEISDSPSLRDRFINFFPIRILREAIRAVPAVKYALGIAGIVSVISIVAALGLDLRIAAFGTVIMIFLMTLLVIFAKLTAVTSRYFLLPVLVLMWSSLILTIATASSLFSSVFFRWPVDLQYWINPPPKSEVLYEKPDNADIELEVLSAEINKPQEGFMYHPIIFSVKAKSKSALPIPIDGTSSLVISGNDGELREEVRLDINCTTCKQGLVLSPNSSTILILKGSISKNIRELLDKQLTAYLQIYYDKKLSEEPKWFLTDFFDFSRSIIKQNE